MKVGRKPLNLTCPCGQSAAAKGLCMRCYQARYNLKKYPHRVVREIPTEAPVIVYPPRPCMECKRVFNPEGPFNRQCRHCHKHFSGIGGKDVRSDHRRNARD